MSVGKILFYKMKLDLLGLEPVPEVEVRCLHVKVGGEAFVLMSLS